MEQRVLITTPQEPLRLGLKTIFLEDSRVSAVYETTNEEDTYELLTAEDIDLLVINQSLISEIRHLPEGKFVILTAQPDLPLMREAYRHGARGYLSESASADLLRSMLNPVKGSFLIEPTLTPWVMERIFGNPQYSVNNELLTPREREIILLLRAGLDKSSIAQQLCITEATLKTHIKNISRKREKGKYAIEYATS